MSDKGSIKFQEALANKIKVWEKTEDFAAGSSNRQKLNRSLNLLLGSDPEVIIDMLGGDFVPDNPREAMNLIRGLDLKTLKSMEIFSLKGLGDKLVGHHEVAANTLGDPLRYMKPKERLDVYKGLADMGQRYGMDTRQILLIADSVHKNIAHDGDFSGKKTGVLLPYITGESGVDFLKRFESSIKKQVSSASRAVNAPITQNYYQAINAVEAQIGLPKGTLIDPNTPLTVKSAATNLLTPTAEQVRTIAKSGENITENVTDVLTQTEFSQRSVNNLIEAVGQTNIDADVASAFDFSGSTARFSTKGFVARGLARSILPSAALGGVSLALGAGDVQAREERAQQDPSFINKFQAGLARTEQAADVAGLVPGPQTLVSEPVGFGAGLTNVAIDVARDTIGTLQAVGGSFKWLVGGGAAKQQRQILNPLSTRL